MGLVACKDCGKQFSTDAKACPSCGARKPAGFTVGTAFKWMAAGFVLLVVYRCTSAIQSVDAGRPAETAMRAMPIATAAQEAAALKDAERQARAALSGPVLMARLKAELLAHCEAEDRHLNYIKVVQRGSGKTLGLFCVHDLYTRYAMSAGSSGPALERWMSEWHAELRRVGVKRVGRFGTGEYATGSWLSFQE